jgi:hypothetical protein
VKTYAAIAGIVVVALLLFIVIAKMRGRHSPRSRRAATPTDVRFKCARCSELFPHTKRTVAAWTKGSRQLFCDDCHRKWRSAQPRRAKPERETTTVGWDTSPNTASRQSDPPPSRWSDPSSRQPVPLPASSRYASTEPRQGCLGVSMLFLIVPMALVLVVTLA